MKYRKVSVQIWNDARFAALSDDGKFSFLFLLTHPHLTCLGAMRANLEGLAAELRWPAARLRRALAPAITGGMLEVNDTVSYLAIPKFLRHNGPEGPNSVKKAWPQALELIPDCPEKQLLIARCRAYLKGTTDDFRNAIPDAVWDAFRVAIQHAIGDACPTPEPEPEQEQKPEQETPPVVPLTGDPLPIAPPGFIRFWEHYPNRVGQDKALESWRRKKCEPIADEVVAGLQRTMAHITREGGKFIPLPATWLSQGRWRDEPAKMNGNDRRRVNDAWEGQQAGEVKW